MTQKYSQELVARAIDFLRAAKQELGNELGYERATKMFDQFDPDLFAQIFMMMLVGDEGDRKTLHISVDPNVATPQKINAIKHLRQATGLGLKAAKDVFDEAEHRGCSIVYGNLRSEDFYSLRRELRGTGYIVA